MAEAGDLEFYKRRAVFLSHRSLLELELVLMEALRKELPARVTSDDGEWLKELVQVLELDDYALLDAIMGTTELDKEYDPKIIDLLQSYLPGRIN
jgi:succinate dehydrogenase flavin-adding protein (antitoxin of CptAB toxin-antitoxin module)